MTKKRPKNVKNDEKPHFLTSFFGRFQGGNEDFDQKVVFFVFFSFFSRFSKHR
jgi:hypothetical protein